MSHIAKHISSIFRLPSLSPASLSCEFQQLRGIRVRVNNGNLESALRVMKRKMDSSGIERLIKREQIYHLKNSQKRVLARQRLERRIQSEDFNRKLKAILFRKLRGM